MSEQTGRIRRNFLFSFLSQFIRMITSFLLFIGIARVYGPEAFGQFTAAHALSTIFILVADFGFDTLLTSKLSRRQEQIGELFRIYFSTKIVFAVFATCLMIATALVQTVSPATKELMYIFSFYVFFSSLTNFFFALFRSLEKFHHETRIFLWMNLLLLGSAAIFGFLKASLVVITIAFVASRLIGLAMALATASKLVDLSRLQLVRIRKSELVVIAVFGFQAIFATLFFTQDTILLSWWTNDQAVGIYQAVFKIVGFTLLAAEIISLSLIPVLSRLHENEIGTWRVLNELLHKTLLYVGSILGLVAIVFAEPLISLLYGMNSYGDAVSILRVFGCTIVIRHLCESSAAALTSSQRQHVRLYVVASATIINFVLNVFIIPRYGVMGAAFVSLFTNIFVSLGYTVGAGSDSLRLFLNWKIYLIPLASASLGFIIWSANWNDTLIALPFAVVALIVTTFAIGFSKKERSYILSFKGLMSGAVSRNGS